ncbi:hypothetical protein BD626DRAFT_451581 [Schizophyllum amplum]|uniref:MYND-type domain-containing protein n=1 Tax=Schizophyllum amplum TaxID=97359 RepID=A0A550CP43_9AGAR|nr:hypothetical protein BD626DRAFT_451581 [Auriculariopsis ampla]
MSLPLIWPGSYFFYPIGNTSAVCLTRDLAPERPATVLLLGCGDPRNVLYTIFCEPRTPARTLDFTCNDSDPAILARNIVLLTMIIDRQPKQTIWNVFYHMKLDKQSHSSLVAQCKKLLAIGSSVGEWEAGLYSTCIRFCSPYTYSEVRRHWGLYMAMHTSPKQTRNRIDANYTSRVKQALDLARDGASARSAGPLARAAADVMAQKYKAYWRSGTVFDDSSQNAPVVTINPMFVYSLGGERFSVQMGLDPLTGFHYADLFANATGDVTSAEVAAHAMAEFGAWSTSFADAVSARETPTPIVRFLLGEATAVCRALRLVAASRTVKTNVPVAHYQSATIDFVEGYASDGTDSYPVEFNVIDTSNLDDHIGLLNCLVAPLPLLSSAADAALYTESLLFRTADATTELKRRLHADIATMALLIGIAPVDFLSSFSSRSNVHELRAQQAAKKPADQFHQVTTWKRSSSCDAQAAARGAANQPILFEPKELADVLLKMYNSMFEQEDPEIYEERNRDVPEYLATGNQFLIYYNRESFVVFLDLVRDNVRMTPEKWKLVIYHFGARNMADRTRPHDSARRHELHTLMQHLGVYTPAFPPEAGPGQVTRRLHAWSSIPDLVRFVVSVPRKNLKAYLGNPMSESADERRSTSMQRQTFGLQFHIGGRRAHVFTAIQVAFGTALSAGTASQPSYVFQADPAGWLGSAPLVATFIVPIRLLESLDSFESQIRLTSRLDEVQGGNLPPIFLQTNIWAGDSVMILPADQQPLPASKPCPLSDVSDGTLVSVGDGYEPVVLSRRNRVGNYAGNVVVAQRTPCILSVAVAAVALEDVVFPFPVMGEEQTVTFEEEGIIKISAPAAGPFTSGGLQVNPFPINGCESRFTSWNLHRLALHRMPVLRHTKKDSWLKSHLRFSLSSRERASRSDGTVDPLIGLKTLLTDMITRTADAGPAHPVFAISTTAAERPDWVVFANDLRLDLQCHTIVLNANVLQAGEGKQCDVETALSDTKAMHHIFIDPHTMAIWQRVLPALAERCRSWPHAPDCELAATKFSALHEPVLCGCGRGQCVSMPQELSAFAPFVTQVVLSPLFGVSYLEPVLRGRRCNDCGKKENLRLCARCKKVKYCGAECQKRDWKVHKVQCQRITP